MTQNDIEWLEIHVPDLMYFHIEFVLKIPVFAGTHHYAVHDSLNRPRNVSQKVLP